MSYQDVHLGLRGGCSCGFDLAFIRSELDPDVFECECKACNRLHAYRVTNVNVEIADDSAILAETDAEVADVTSKFEDMSPVARVKGTRKARASD